MSATHWWKGHGDLFFAGIGRWSILVSNLHLRIPVHFSDVSVSAVDLLTPEAGGDDKFEIELGEEVKTIGFLLFWLIENSSNACANTLMSSMYRSGLI